MRTLAQAHRKTHDRPLPPEPDWAEKPDMRSAADDVADNKLAPSEDEGEKWGKLLWEAVPDWGEGTSPWADCGNATKQGWIKAALRFRAECVRPWKKLEEIVRSVLAEVPPAWLVPERVLSIPVGVEKLRTLRTALEALSADKAYDEVKRIHDWQERSRKSKLAVEKDNQGDDGTITPAETEEEMGEEALREIEDVAPSRFPWADARIEKWLAETTPAERCEWIKRVRASVSPEMWESMNLPDAAPEEKAPSEDAPRYPDHEPRLRGRPARIDEHGRVETGLPEEKPGNRRLPGYGGW